MQQAIGKLLLIRLQGDQFDAVAFRVGEEAAVGAGLVVRDGLGIGSPFNSVPDRASHTFVSPGSTLFGSPPTVTMRVPSGLNATLSTRVRVPLQFQQGRAGPARPTPSPSGPSCR